MIMEDVVLLPNTPPPPQMENGLQSLFWITAILTLGALLLGGFFYSWNGTRTPRMSGESLVEIPSGSSVSEIAQLLKAGHIIRDEQFFRILVRWQNVDTALPSGTFLFRAPQTLFAVVEQLSTHNHGIERVRVTIPEGLTVAQMGTLLTMELPHFSVEEFQNVAHVREGYLFPDTYFFFSTATSGVVMEMLVQNFETKTKDIQEEVRTAGKSWHDIVIMASIIEEEAVTPVDRKMVSGILWNRIARDMRLQVDASFAYIMNKASSEITVDDLNSDSPYNTYRYKGLPPAPIANPGLAAIEAALHPTPSAYLYYLSDRDGVMHYAKTFEEHKLNKARYLR